MFNGEPPPRAHIGTRLLILSAVVTIALLAAILYFFRWYGVVGIFGFYSVAAIVFHRLSREEKQ